MDYVIYDKAGKILRTVDCSPALANKQVKEAEFIMEGTADDSKQKVIGTGKSRRIVNKTLKEIKADNPPPSKIPKCLRPAFITNEQWQDVLSRLSKLDNKT